MSEKRDPATDQQIPEPNSNPSMHDEAVQLLLDRKAHGQTKYGALLQPFNGRSFEQDAVEEAADLLVYLLGLRWERQNPVMGWLYPLCWALLSGEDPWGRLETIPGIPVDVVRMANDIIEAVDNQSAPAPTSLSQGHDRATVEARS